MRTAQRLISGYVVLSLLTIIVVVLLRHHTALVTPAVWVRSCIVGATSLLMVLFVARAARGDRRSYLRLRIASAVMVVAIAVVVALPGAFPVWLRAEQALCGLLLLGVVFSVNGRRARAAFARGGN